MAIGICSDTIEDGAPAGVDSAIPDAALQAALDMTGDIVLFLDVATLNVLHANRRANELFDGAQDQQVSGHLFDVAPEFSQPPLRSKLKLLIDEGATEVRCTTRFGVNDGSCKSCDTICRLVPTLEGQLLVVVAHDRDRVAGRGGQSEVQDSRDELTGLSNRAALQVRLESAVRRARVGDDRFAVFFIDVDWFKQINDSRGHLIGDEVLRVLAQRLQHSVRPIDLVARYGGDEFVVVVHNVDSDEEVVQIARRMQEELTSTVCAKGCAIEVSASIGIALSHDCHASADQLLHEADQAMYEAKARGRSGRFVIRRSRRRKQDRLALS